MAVLSSVVNALSTLTTRTRSTRWTTSRSTVDDPACSRRCRPSPRSPTRSRSASRSSTRTTRCRLLANFLHMMFGVPAEPYEVDPERRAGAEPAAHPARRPRAELLDVDGAPRRLVAGQPLRLDLRPASARCGARCTAARTRRCSRCSSRSSRTAATCSEFVRKVKNHEARRQADGLRPPRLQELRPARGDHQGAAPTRSSPSSAQATRCSTSQGARRGRAQRRLLHRAQALPERRLLHRHHLPGDGLPDQDVHGAVRARPPARLDRALEGDASRTRTTKIGRPRQIYTGATERDYAASTDGSGDRERGVAGRGEGRHHEVVAIPIAA